MNIQTTGAAKRLIFSLLLASFLGGCAVYAPPYAGYDSYSYPYAYGPPVYTGPPVSLDLGFGFYDYGYSGYHRGHGVRNYGYRGFDRGNRGGYRGFGQGRGGRGRR